MTKNEETFLAAFHRYMDNEKEHINMKRAHDLLEAFEHVKMEKIKTVETVQTDRPVLICVVKNERVRLKHFFSHYRKLGIEKFVMIDNLSSDGTREYCEKQEDADVYSVADQYSSAGRVAWTNKVIAAYGYNRWYLIVDADEYIDYVNSETYGIDRITGWAKKNGIQRVLGLQIDFYQKGHLFEYEQDSIKWDECIYFDTDSYILQPSGRCRWYVGGPRKRVLDTYSLLTKCPLVYITEEDVNISSHYLYPYEKNFQSGCVLAICHFEFLNQADRLKLDSIVREGIYASGSKENKAMHRVIADMKGDISFWSKESEAYQRSRDLLKISAMDEMVMG